MFYTVASDQCHLQHIFLHKIAFYPLSGQISRPSPQGRFKACILEGHMIQLWKNAMQRCDRAEIRVQYPGFRVNKFTLLKTKKDFCQGRTLRCLFSERSEFCSWSSLYSGALPWALILVILTRVSFHWRTKSCCLYGLETSLKIEVLHSSERNTELSVL